MATQLNAPVHHSLCPPPGAPPSRRPLGLRRNRKLCLLLMPTPRPSRPAAHACALRGIGLGLQVWVG
eukprot:362584-Chlamydomonas_euryale.AAC.5